MRKKMAIGAIAVICLGGGWLWRANHVSLVLADKAAAAAPAGGARQGAATSVVTVAAASGDFPVRLKSIGNVEPLAVVAVKSRVQSQLLSVHFTEGQMVKQGELMFSLDDRELAAQVAKDVAAIARDEATLTRSKADLARAQQLLAKNAGTQQALDQATADQASAAASLQADQAALDADKLRLSYTSIYAPIAGRAGAVSVTPGNLVNASDTGPGLVVLTPMKPVRIAFTLPERELPRVQGAMATGKPPAVRAIPHGGSGASATGVLNFIDSSINQASGTITLKAEFANENLGLWPGEYRDVEVDLGVHANAVSVPTVALQEGQKGSFVYVVGAESRAELRVVTPGLIDGDRTEIVAGLKAGERVVVDGQLRLAAGAAVREATGTPGAAPSRGS